MLAHAANANAVSKTRIFEPDNPAFQKSFDEKAFEFRHELTTSHPLFTRERLRRLLISQAARNCVYYNAGEIRIDQRWDTVPPRTKPVEEVFDTVESAGAWIVLRQVHDDPEYKLLLEDCLSEIKMLSGRSIEKDKKSQEADIYITSPGRVTMYHVDPICNFLMQISGEKQIHVFDRKDREVLPEEELERYWSEDDYSVKYRPEFEDRGQVFTMRPGAGVHVPVNHPHWLKNGDNISISLSINYHYRDSRRKNVYQANYYLRKMGLKPKPLGSSALVDSMKGSVVTVTRAVKSKLKGSKVKS